MTPRYLTNTAAAVALVFSAIVYTLTRPADGYI